MKGERSILAQQQRTLEQFEHVKTNSKVFQPESPSKFSYGKPQQ